MDVLYASNDGFVMHLGTSLCSLLVNNRQAPSIAIHIFSIGLSEQNKQRLRGLAQAYDRQICFYELGDLRERFAMPIDTGGFDISIMGRLFMGELLPKNINRVLYLDCDTVILRSLGGLWHTKLEGKILGAVMEPTIYEAVRDSIDLGEEEPYFNSGVLLVDVRRWREEHVQEKLMSFLRDKGGKLFASDQDLLNGTLKGRILPLMPRYNFFTNYRYFHYRDMIRHAPWYAPVSRREWRRAKKHPVIVHFMGDERPWIAGNLNHYRGSYETYLAMTPWAGAPKEEGKRLYMLAYHVLDYVTAVCPRVRWEISRRLGMKLVNARRKKR